MPYPSLADITPCASAYIPGSPSAFYLITVQNVPSSIACTSLYFPVIIKDLSIFGPSTSRTLCPVTLPVSSSINSPNTITLDNQTYIKSKEADDKGPSLRGTPDFKFKVDHQELWAELFHPIVSQPRWKGTNGKYSGKDWIRGIERNLIKCSLIHD